MKYSDFCRTCAALRIVALLLWLAGVLWLSLAPTPPRPPDVLSWDKLRHAGAYAVATFLSGRVFVLFSVTPSRGWIWAFAFAVAFGGIMEIAQGLLSEVRYAEFGDMLANACGAGFVLAAAFVWPHLAQRKNL